MTKVDILLIRAKGVEGNTLPQGLLSIQSFLKEQGYIAEIWDRYINKSIKQLKNVLKDIAVVGISAMTSQAKDAIYLAKKIKRWYPKIKIIVGGVHFTALPGDALGIADNVVVGEGETTIKNYLDSGCVSNFEIKGNPVKNLDDISKIAMADVKSLVRQKNCFHILTSRGCTYRCNFCLGESQRPKGIRYHSIDYIVDYIKDIIKTLGIKSFFIVDDIFVLNSKRVYAFCDAVESKIHDKINLECFTHAGHGDLKLYQRMKAVGFNKISFGVEHGNNRLLEFCGKKTTTKTVEETCSIIRKAGIELNLTYILGNATETNKTIAETVDFGIYLHKKCDASSWFSFMQPLPGSDLYNRATKYGKWLIKNNNQFTSNIKPVYLPFGVSRKHLINEHKRGMRGANK